MTGTIDYLIIGAGPAGLQLAARLERSGRNYRVLEAGGGPGTFFETYPRHRTLISVNKRYTGSSDPEFSLRMDWNSILSSDTDDNDPSLLFTARTRKYFPDADELVRYLRDFAEKTGVNVSYDSRVENVVKKQGLFEIITRHETLTARTVIVATGVSKLNFPDVEGADTIERYDTVSVDPDDFIDQRVLILGKGNSAFETADNLVETAAVLHVAGASPIRLAWRTTTWVTCAPSTTTSSTPTSSSRRTRSSTAPSRASAITRTAPTPWCSASPGPTRCRRSSPTTG